MTDLQNDETDSNRLTLRSRLVSWPLTLIGLTAAVVLAANSVSAWARGGLEDLDEFKEHAAYRVERMLNKIDATDAQSEAIQAIVADTIDTLHATHTEREAHDGRLRDLLTAEAIDREAIEALRGEHLAGADAMTRLVADRMADVLEILTAEQRAELVARFEKMRDRHGRHRWH